MFSLALLEDPAEIRAERIGRDTSYGKIIEAVEQAERSRARCAERSAVPAPVAMPA
jgi:cation transport ATPase